MEKCLLIELLQLIENAKLRGTIDADKADPTGTSPFGYYPLRGLLMCHIAAQLRWLMFAFAYD